MKQIIILLIVLFGSFTAECEDIKSRAKKIAESIGVATLQSDLRHLTSTPAGQRYEIQQSAWPDSVKRFNPSSVLRHGESGVLIVLEHSDGKNEGLLVMLSPEGDPGTGGSGSGYERLAPSLYWCWEKVRAAYSR